ncbi:MAG TPA: alpha/beta fold hydrolase [Blastocatellia bacterium]|nr:alpha/beta fold hydrolase [Blastocatellia bacterium]
MFVKRDGEGSEVCFGLHGWSGTHTTFAPLVPHLPPGVALYSVDLPGYGQSPPPRRWDLAGLTDEIAATIEGFGAEAVTLIGNCSGALLGLLAAERVSGRIKRLVLIDPFAYLPWYFKVFVAPGLGRYAYYSTFANPVGRWITNQSLTNHRAAKTDLTESFHRVDHAASYRYLRLLAGIEGIEQFAGLRQPIDLVYGARTFGAVKESVARWRGIWPQARSWELAEAGHLPIVEAPAALSRILFPAASLRTESQREL